MAGKTQNLRSAWSVMRIVRIIICLVSFGFVYPNAFMESPVAETAADDEQSHRG